MPSTLVKELYIAKSLEELEKEVSKITVLEKPTSMLIKSAKKVFESAEILHLDKDEEKAYVQYMRFVEIVLSLNKRDDFKKSEEYEHMFECCNTALSKATALKDSLKNRYSLLQEAVCREKNEKNSIISELHKNKAEIKGEVPKLPAVESTVKSTEKLTITSSELHYLMTSTSSSIIIMDTRSAEDFEESHIKSTRCINVPKEILKPGITAARLESLLPKESLFWWFRRKDADLIVLIDWDSKDENTTNVHVNALKHAICKWDTSSIKKTPVILIKGYRDWVAKYPMYTTRALNFDTFNGIKTSPIQTDLSAIQYPNLDEDVTDNSVDQNESNFNNMLFKKSTSSVSILNGAQSNLSELKKPYSAPAIDRKNKPPLHAVPKSANSENKLPKNPIHSNSYSGIPVQEKKSLPSVDRKSKNGVTNSTEKNNLLNSLNKEESLAKESLELAKQNLKNEEEFKKLCLRKELEAEESKRKEIQKQEEILIQKLRELELQSKEKDIELQKLTEENSRMKQLIGQKVDEDIKTEKEKEIARNMKDKEALNETVQKLREERKKKEAEIRKKKDSSNANPRESTSANSALKRLGSHGDKPSNHLNNPENTLSLSKQVSSDGSSRGLVRSHSSPNIAQMVNDEETVPHKPPVIDRSLKPKVPSANSQSNEINRARLRNLNPIYGHCPVVGATGLRNLGNTCFMNSVIQCLSNTAPLAEYFNSGNYVEHINRDNKQGTGGELVEEFAVIIKTLWMGQYKSFYPKDFKNIISKSFPAFIGNEQHDSHEFLIVLMEKLHADLNRRYFKVPPILDPNVTENAFWEHHKSYNSSKISDIFDGLLKSTLTCLSCRKTSDNFEVFSCLSLPISASRCTLRDCFQHFLKPEKISGEAGWDCPRCKQKKEAEKRLHICRLPVVLIVQLKRFSYEGLWRRKLQTTVDFDINFEVPYEENSHERSCIYSLYGIVNHYGTLEGGHYTAFCKSPSSSRWFKYDDHEVSEISQNDIKTSAAYLLFYIATDFHSKL